MSLTQISLLTSILECLLCSGIVYGWTYIADVFLDYGYFSYVCEGGTNVTGNLSVTVSNLKSKSCYDAETELNLVYTVAVATCSSCTFLFGFVFDKWGNWVTRTAAIAMFGIASLIMVFAPVQQSFMLYPAMLLFSFGGSSIMICNLNLANLSSKHRSLFIAIFNGAYDSSVTVFFLVKMAYDNGFPLPTVFVILACSTFLWTVRTFTLTPRWRAPYPLPKNFVYGIADLKALSTRGKIEQGKDSSEKSDEAMTLSQPDSDDDRTFVECLKDPFYWGNVAHMSVLHLREVFFLGTAADWLETLSEGDPIDSYLFVYGIFTLLGVVVAPFCGLLIDKLQRKFAGASEDRIELLNAGMLSSSISVGIASLTATVFSFTVALPFLQLQYVSFALCTLFRAFLYASTASFVVIAYPTKHIGKLFGVLVTTFGLVTYLQYPLLNLALIHGYVGINIGFLIASALTTLHPLALFLHYKRRWRNTKAAELQLATEAGAPENL